MFLCPYFLTYGTTIHRDNPACHLQLHTTISLLVQPITKPHIWQILVSGLHSPHSFAVFLGLSYCHLLSGVIQASQCLFLPLRLSRWKRSSQSAELIMSLTCSKLCDGAWFSAGEAQEPGWWWLCSFSLACVPLSMPSPLLVYTSAHQHAPMLPTNATYYPLPFHVCPTLRSLLHSCPK